MGEGVGARDAALDGMRRPRVLICGSLHLAGKVLAAEPETWPP
jgi:folylpolyglutamate synthase/dihydropteroate synthase